MASIVTTMATSVKSNFSAGDDHAESVAQLSGKIQIFLVCADSHFAGFDLLKRMLQAVAVFISQDLLCHRKEAIIFLPNMVAKKLDVGAGMIHKLLERLRFAASCTIQGVQHRSNVSPSLIVLVKHDSNRSLLA